MFSCSYLKIPAHRTNISDFHCNESNYTSYIYNPTKTRLLIEQTGVGCQFPAGMNFSGKDLNDTYFIKAGLAQANFSKAQLKGVMFNDATLIGANFSKADLSNSSFKRADISATDMRDSILHGANFLQAYFEQGSAELEPKIYRALYDKHTLGLKELKIDKRKMCTDLPCRPAVPEI